MTAQPPAPPAARPRGLRGRIHRADAKWSPYLFIAPFFLIFTAFGLFPLLYNGVVSLRTWQLDSPDRDGWAGLENYRALLTDSDWWNALVNTVGMFLLSSVPQLVLALLLAGVLNRKLRFPTLMRMGVLLPYVTPIAASTLVFSAFFARDYGIANYLLSVVHVDPIDWRADKWSSWVAIATMVNWRWIGYNALIYLAAMQSVPRDLYEAASIDGAGPRRQFWSITVPMIRPTLLFTVVLSTIGGMQLFTEPLLFDNNVSNATGGSSGQFQTVAELIYKTGWIDLDLGYAAAMSWAVFMVIIILAGLNSWLTNRVGRR
ncbi:MAG TPA: sugar ABC transporter permease [Candidatus Lustribacter sp.]|nr:sugar ABC transporter permease [Candidatus Lustribacter sp.]